MNVYSFIADDDGKTIWAQRNGVTMAIIYHHKYGVWNVFEAADTPPAMRKAGLATDKDFPTEDMACGWVGGFLRQPELCKQ